MTEKNTIQLPFVTLLVIFTFAPINAVLFTPALPDIAKFFQISIATAQQTISWFLIGYAIGQLIYSPLANRFGRKTALYAGIVLQMVGSLLCVLAEISQKYSLLLIGRFFIALGSGVGLNMTVTLVNECYEPQKAAQTLSFLILGWAFFPSLSIALGGFLNAHFGWVSCFYVSTLYGFIVLSLITRLPETLGAKNFDALKLRYLWHNYVTQFKNIYLITNGILLGLASSFVYIFASLSPFIAINHFGMSSEEYGIASILPSIGLVLGSLSSAILVKYYPLKVTIGIGIGVAVIGSLLMFLAIQIFSQPLIALFLPMIIIYFGMILIPPGISVITLQSVKDKASASAVLNFINVGISPLVIFSIGFFSTKIILFPIIYLILGVSMIIFYFFGIKKYG